MKTNDYEHRTCNLIIDLNTLIDSLQSKCPQGLLRARAELEKAIEELSLAFKDEVNYSEQYCANMAGLTLDEYREENK